MAQLTPTQSNTNETQPSRPGAATTQTLEKGKPWDPWSADVAYRQLSFNNMNRSRQVTKPACDPT